jgi:hypothetical protein
MQPMSMPVMPLRDVIMIHVLPPTISALAVIVVGWLASKKQLAKTQELHVTFNDRMDKALISERASGVLEGRLAERDERDNG